MGNLAEVVKPPYRPMSMAEIREIPPNGMTAISTFSGCGGSCLGLRMAGFRTLWASEFIPEAAATYRANFPDAILDERDIREVKPEEVLAAIGRAPSEIDLMEGSPPCASFSSSGRVAASWGKVKQYSSTRQRVDDLFFEFVRLLGGIRPRAFFAENVDGLARGASIGIFKQVLRALRDQGYRVEARILNAAWLGVPQNRRRLIFVGVREDLGRDPAFPKPLPYQYTLGEALALARNEPCDLDEASIAKYAIGRLARRLGSGEQDEKRFNLIRARLDRPAPTTTQTASNPGAAAAIHPTEMRKFTIPELKLISGFPEDFVLTGTYRQRGERIGRAVPPPMSFAIARTIRDEILAPKEVTR